MSFWVPICSDWNPDVFQNPEFGLITKIGRPFLRLVWNHVTKQYVPKVLQTVRINSSLGIICDDRVLQPGEYNIEDVDIEC